MSGPILFAAGLMAGVVLALQLRPATESSCCNRVRAGVRDKIGGLCGPMCQRLGDALGITKNSPDLLDALGVDQ